jgi:hypothetical protein
MNMKTHLLAAAAFLLAIAVYADEPALPVDLDRWILRYPATNSVGDGDLSAVAYGNGRFVAVGSFYVINSYYSANIVTSPDGVTWARQNSVTNASLFGITYADGKFVAVGRSSEGDGVEALILTSLDGTSWSPWRSGASGRSSDYGLRDVTYGNGTFVAVGYGDGFVPVIVTSPDGTNWNEQGGGTRAFLSGVSYGSGLFVAVGSRWDLGQDQTLILTSPDGTTWTPRSGGTNTPLNCIAYGNGVFVAGGGSECSRGFSAVIMTSSDGITWTTQTPDPRIALSRISFANGTFVAVRRTSVYENCLNTNSIVTSPDGVTWMHRYSNGFVVFAGITFGHDSFVMVGDGGMILQSGTLPVFHPTASARLGDGTMRLVLGAQTGAELLLEASTNLTDWAALATLTNSLGTVSYLDVTASNFNQRFYRARQISQ